MGSSLGGNIAYVYGAHGKYAMTAIFPCIATPDFSLLPDDVLIDRVHERLPEYYDELFTKVNELLFG